MGDRSKAGMAIRRLFSDTRRDLASMERNNALLAGCLAAGALLIVAVGAAYLILRAYDSSPAALPASATLPIAIAVAVVGLAAVVTFVLVRRAVYALETARNAMLLRRFTAHFREVLYDRGLLALVLGNDPRYSVPVLAQYLGVPPIHGQRGTAAAVSSFSQRIELLLNYYGLLCKHYRIEAYPDDNPFVARGADPVRLRGLPRQAMIFVLEEGIDRFDVDADQPQP